MASLSTSQSAKILRGLGWKSRTSGEQRQDVAAFQGGWNLGPALTVDGKVGPATSHALLVSDERRGQRQPTASAHFGFGEFMCTCGGRYGACRLILVSRGLLVGLEVYRSRCSADAPVTIVSGYRCPDRNRLVGGAGASQHMLGKASDVARHATADAVQALGVFGGIGWQDPQHLVRHVDDRPLFGAPTKWQYAV